MTSGVTGPIGVSTTTDTRTGYLIGFYYSFLFSDQFGLQPELLYNSMGAKVGSSTISLNYVSLPVFVRYNATEQLHFLAAPQLSYLLSGKGETTSPSGTTSTDVKDTITSADLSLSGGLGVDLKNFNIGLRYVLGLNNIAKNPSGSASGFDYEYKLRNRGWQIVAGYRLSGR